MPRRLLKWCGIGAVELVFVFLPPAAFAKPQTEWQFQSSPQQNSPEAQSSEDKGTQSPQQSPDSSKKPEKPPQGENESANPAQVAAEKTKELGVEAKHATKLIAQEGLVRMRLWEQSWLTGVYVDEQQPLVALTANQRQHIYLEQTLITPGAYLKRMLGAGIDQARGVPSQWDDGWAGYVERFASREGQFVAANSLAYAANAKLGYEVRYDLCRCTGLWRRTRHAMVRNFATYDRTELNWRPQLGLYAGAFGGGLISTAWKPHPRNAFAEGGGHARPGELWNVAELFY